MGDPDKLPADGDRPLGDSPVPHPWGHASVRSSAAGRLTLVEVEGELDAPAVGHWRDLVNSAIMEGATGIVVDLRGCHAIDIGCLSVLVAASGKLKERGDGGVNMVTTPRVAPAAHGPSDWGQAAGRLRLRRGGAARPARLCVDRPSPAHAGLTSARYWRAMSQENVDVARQWYEVLSRWLESYWANPGRPLAETPGTDEMFDRMDAEAEWDWLFSRETFRGRDQLLRAAADWIETVDAWQIEVEELIDGAGGRVVVIVRVVARGRESGAPVHQRVFSVITVRDGKVARIHDHTDRNQALQAAGLRE